MKRKATENSALDYIHADLRDMAVPLESLVLDPGNARVHDSRNLAAITQSLKRFGFRSPVVVQREGRIVRAGNGRCLAARGLGWTHVPAIFVDDTSREAMLFALSDNRTAELAAWDEARLAEMLEELREETDGIEWLWSKAEVDEVLEQLVEPVAAIAESAPEDLAKPEAPETRSGDLIVLGRHRLLCGDSTNGKDVTRLLAGAVPQIMVTDPPYGVEYDAAWRNRVGLSHSAQIGRVANDHRASWAAAWNHFPGSIAYVWHAGLNAGVVERSLGVVGFEPRAQIIWVKRRFVISRGAYHWRHEACSYAVRKGAKAEWAGGRKQDTVWADVVDQFDVDSAHELFACQVSRDSVYAFGAAATTVWEMPNDVAVGGGHATQKPIEAMARPIRNHAVDTVYDPFLGTGTTLVAAEQECKRCYGLELDPAYCDVIVRRWERLTGQVAKRSR